MIEKPLNENKQFIEKYEEPSLHMSVLLGASIITLDLRPRFLYPLWNAGIRTIEQLSEKYRSGIISVPQIGKRAEYEIGLILYSYGLFNVHAVHGVHGVQSVNT